MKRFVLIVAVASALTLAVGASDAQAFGHLLNMGGGCGCDSGCGCDAAPSCGCEAAPTCCDSCNDCCRPKCRLFSRLHNCFKRKSCCETTCCAAEKSCGCEAAPSCGCNAAPSCGCNAAPTCCDSCNDCGCRHKCRLFSKLGGLFHKHRGCNSCCETSCGCDAAPSCGCGG